MINKVTLANSIMTDTSREQVAVKSKSVKLSFFTSKAFLPLSIFVFSVVLNLVTVWLKNFDGLYGQDAYSYFAYAAELYHHQSLFHLWQWENTPSILYWPFGYSGLAALFFIVAGATAGAAQLVSIIAWAGVAALTTAIGQKLWDNRVAGTITGLLIALSPLGRQLAISVMSDAAALFWTTLAIWLALHCGNSKRQWLWTSGIGLTLGLAILTRYSAITALPLIPLIIWRNNPKNYRQIFVKCLIIFGIAALIYSPQLIINQLYPDRFWYNSWLDSWTPLNALKTNFLTRDGLASYATPPLVFYLIYTLLNPHFFTPLILLPIGLGLIHLWRQRKDSQNRFIALLLLAWWLIPTLAFSTFTYESERYSLTFMPPLALLAGLYQIPLALKRRNTAPPVSAPDSWTVTRQTHPSVPTQNNSMLVQLSVGISTLPKWLQVRSWRRIGLLATAGFLIGLAILSQKHLYGFIADKDQALATVQQVEKVVPSNSTFITFDISLTFDHYSGYTVRDLWYLNPDQIKSLMATNPNGVYLFADPENMQQQWAGNHVGAAFQAAFSYAKGQPVGKFGRFWLWRLGP